MSSENDDSLYLTVDEAAARLRVGRSTIYDLVRRGEIPHLRLGKVIRIPKSFVEDGATISPARRKPDQSWRETAAQYGARTRTASTPKADIPFFPVLRKNRRLKSD